MIRDYEAIRAAADAIARAADATMEAYRAGRTVEEPSITDRLMGAIETRIADLAGSDHPNAGSLRPAFTWTAKTLRTGSGSAAEEKEFGADLLGVFTADLPDFKTSKGFLAQAKRAEPGKPFSSKDWKRLLGQCERMLRITPDSFVVIYSERKGVRFFPALAVRGLGDRDIFRLYDMPPRAFFERHFQCFIGDERLDRPHTTVLEGIRDERIDGQGPGFVLHLTLTATE